MFAPFPGKIVYKDANWGYVILQSLSKVYWADGSYDYMTVCFMHDENISDLYVGQVISQGQTFYHAGGMGNGNANAYGDHVHLSVHRGHITQEKSYGAGGVFAFDAFFVNKDKTTSTAGRGEGYVYSGNTVYNGAPTNYTGLWKDLSEFEGDLVTETYPTYCTIKVTEDTAPIRNMPCSEKTDPGVVKIETGSKGDRYEAIGLVRNTEDNLWYKVITFPANT